MARRTNALAKAIGERLTAARLDRGLSLRELARRAMMDVQTVVNLSQGKTINPGIGTIAYLARALEVRAAWLGFGEGDGDGDGPLGS